ncbi:MAG: hypothetical protein HY908_15535 [Myxococcales bacterium]|nr:hypothetical protein [Myxococcales bacterium]
MDWMAAPSGLEVPLCAGGLVRPALRRRAFVAGALFGALALGCGKDEPAPRPEPTAAASAGALRAAGSASGSTGVGAAAASGGATAASAAAATSRPNVTPDGAPIRTKEVLSKIYEVDRIYKSMRGPDSVQELPLYESKTPELLWIVGFEALMVAPDGATPISQEWMCHSNLDFSAAKHLALFDDQKPLTDRLFTLSQGQQRIDFPEGYGLPILSSESLSLNTQVLNLNMTVGKKDVRHKISVRFVRDAETRVPYKPLFAGGAFGLKLVEGAEGYFGVDHGDPASQGPGCLPGVAAAPGDYQDAHGRKFTGHWIVKPGREENHTLVTKLLNLPFDTTVHYIAIHLHPFAESLELRDLTTGRSVYKATTRQTVGAIGLEHVDYYASTEGLPLYKDHEYELVSIYDNTTDVDQDSMAVMNMYMLDKAYKRPAAGKAAPAGKP